MHRSVKQHLQRLALSEDSRIYSNIHHKLQLKIKIKHTERLQHPPTF